VAELCHYSFRNFIKQVSDWSYFLRKSCTYLNKEFLKRNQAFTASMPEHTQELILRYMETMLLLIRDSDEVLNNLDLRVSPFPILRELLLVESRLVDERSAVDNMPEVTVALSKIPVVNSIGKIES
jgi:hypothetical protein